MKVSELLHIMAGKYDVAECYRSGIHYDTLVKWYDDYDVKSWKVISPSEYRKKFFDPTAYCYANHWKILIIEVLYDPR